MNDFKQKDVKIMCMTISKLRYDDRKDRDMTMVWDFLLNIIYQVIINSDNAESRDLWRYWDNLLIDLTEQSNTAWFEIMILCDARRWLARPKHG